MPIRVAADGEYWRLLGSAFLHIGLLHLAGNMLSLAIVGPALERVFGWWRFLAIYLLSALGGSVAIYLFGSPFGAVAGASGAIYGLFAATLIVVRKLGLDARFMVLAVALNFAVSFAPGISLLGHLGGFISGGLLTLAMVYAPKASRTPLQIMAIGALVAIMVSLVLIRTDMLLPLGALSGGSRRRVADPGQGVGHVARVGAQRALAEHDEQFAGLEFQGSRGQSVPGVLVDVDPLDRRPRQPVPAGQRADLDAGAIGGQPGPQQQVGRADGEQAERRDAEQQPAGRVGQQREQQDDQAGEDRHRGLGRARRPLREVGFHHGQRIGGGLVSCPHPLVDTACGQPRTGRLRDLSTGRRNRPEYGV